MYYTKKQYENAANGKQEIDFMLLAPETTIRIQTENSVYFLEKHAEDLYTIQGGSRFPIATRIHPRGFLLGNGPSIVIDKLATHTRLEFFDFEKKKPIVTSYISAFSVYTPDYLIEFNGTPNYDE